MNIDTLLITGALSTIFGFIISLMGGWSIFLETLFILILLDIITGILTCMYKSSHHTRNGKFSSSEFYRGLLKKGMIIIVIIVANRFDLIFNFEYLTNIVIMFFIINEMMSIIENAGLIGLPLPKKLMDVLEVFSEEPNKPLKR